MIEIVKLTKKFGQTLAVDNLSLTIEGGEIFGFLGPNGSGKTTTIKMLTGLYRPTSGQAIIGGYDIEKEPEKAKSLIGYIPDEPFVYEQLTGWEFLNFVGTIYGIPSDLLEERIKRLLSVFPTMEVIDGYFGDYSRGTKQKITILAALLHEPDLLIIDEPIVGLDPQSVRIVKDLLREFVAGGKTVFMSTHSLDVAESICTRIAILNHGKMEDEGSPERLKQIANMSDKSLEDLFISLTSA